MEQIMNSQINWNNILIHEEQKMEKGNKTLVSAKQNHEFKSD
jgi:hypothetical protein